MSQWSTRKGIKLETPTIYRIRVRAHLDGSWFYKVGGMVITKAFRDNGHSVTMLEGLLLDQEALAGVLNQIHELRLPLLCVECLDI